MKSMLLAGVVLAGAGLAGGVGLRGQAAPTASEAAPAASVVPDAEQQAASQVRIVRLSQVHGSVRMDRNTGRGFEGAFTNIPVVAGAKLLTGEGVAEVEFEDNSSMRLAPESEVEFSRLGRTAAGETLTTVRVGKGLVYISMQKGKGAGEFVLADGAAQIVMGPGAHVRLDATQSQVELAVFEGSAQLVMGRATTTLAKKETVALNPALQTMAAVVKGTQEASWDGWDKSQTSYHKGVSAFSGSGGGFGLFGANDLNYYGSFVDAGGCGMMWRPYFASAGWDPFANGVWAYYPGAGYSWVSPYPWGWMPFHSGSWTNCGAAGWGWRPGGTWAGVNNHVLLQVPGRVKPVPMPPKPVKGASTLIPVNTRPLTMSGISQKGFSFRQDSAGLGVPRGEFGRLNGVAAHVQQHGEVTSSVSTTAYAGPATGRSVNGAAGVPVSSGARVGLTPASSSPRSYGGSMGAPSIGSSGGGMHSGGAMSMPSGGGGSAPSAGASSGGGHH